jgi:hypothetical protein
LYAAEYRPTAALPMSPAMAAPPNRRKEAPDADAFGAAALSGNRTSEQHNHVALRLVGNHNLKVFCTPTLCNLQRMQQNSSFGCMLDNAGPALGTFLATPTIPDDFGDSIGGSETPPSRSRDAAHEDCTRYLFGEAHRPGRAKPVPFEISVAVPSGGDGIGFCSAFSYLSRPQSYQPRDGKLAITW